MSVVVCSSSEHKLLVRHYPYMGNGSHTVERIAAVAIWRCRLSTTYIRLRAIFGRTLDRLNIRYRPSPTPESWINQFSSFTVWYFSGRFPILSRVVGNCGLFLRLNLTVALPEVSWGRATRVWRSAKLLYVSRVTTAGILYGSSLHRFMAFAMSFALTFAKSGKWLWTFSTVTVFSSVLSLILPLLFSCRARKCQKEPFDPDRCLV